MKKLLLLFTFAFGLFSFSFAQEYGWTDIRANIPGTPNLTDVFFVSDDEGWIVSNYPDPIIYHTTDGGATFEVQTTQYTCNAIHMLNANEGYAGGAQGRVYRTTDGGDNWTAIGSMGANLADISFPPVGDTGYCCGIDGTIGEITPGGVTQMTSNVNGDLNSISFPDNSEEGWVCGGDVIRHYANNTWNGDQDYPSGGYNAIYMLDSLNGWAVGDGGIIIHTTDGYNWFEQTNPNPNQNSFFGLFFLDENNGWAIATGGTIVHTNNGGENWIVAGAGITSNSLTGVHFTSPTNGYVVGNGKTLLKYTKISGIGEDGLVELEFEVFPNPCWGKIQITNTKIQENSKLNTQNSKLEIIDLFGKVVYQEEVERRGEDKLSVDVSDLPAGMYLVKLQKEDAVGLQKIIKQ